MFVKKRSGISNVGYFKRRLFTVVYTLLCSESWIYWAKVFFNWILCIYPCHYGTQYIIRDKNLCSTSDAFDLTEKIHEGSNFLATI